MDPVVQKADSRSQQISSRADFGVYASCLINTPGCSLFFDPVRSAAEENAWMLSEQDDEQPIAGQCSQPQRNSITSIRPRERESQPKSIVYEKGDWEHESTTGPDRSPEEPHTSKAPLDTRYMLVVHQMYQPLGPHLSVGEALPFSAPPSTATALYQCEGKSQVSNTADGATRHENTSRCTRNLLQKESFSRPRENLHKSCSTLLESSQPLHN